MGGTRALTCLEGRKSVEIRKKMALSPERKENEALMNNISQIGGFDYLPFEQSGRKLAQQVRPEWAEQVSSSPQIEGETLA